MIFLSRKNFILTKLLVLIAVFNFHFITSAHCSQVENHRCESTAKYEKTSKTSYNNNTCCSSKIEELNQHNVEYSEFGVDQCNCFHVLEHDTKSINISKNTQLILSINVIAHITSSEQIKQSLEFSKITDVSKSFNQQNTYLLVQSLLI